MLEYIVLLTAEFTVYARSSGPPEYSGPTEQDCLLAVSMLHAR